MIRRHTYQQKTSKITTTNIFKLNLLPSVHSTHCEDGQVFIHVFRLLPHQTFRHGINLCLSVEENYVSLNSFICPQHHISLDMTSVKEAAVRCGSQLVSEAGSLPPTLFLFPTFSAEMERDADMKRRGAAGYQCLSVKT